MGGWFEVLYCQIKECGAPIFRHLYSRTADVVCLAEGNACSPRPSLTLAISSGLLALVSCLNVACVVWEPWILCLVTCGSVHSQIGVKWDSQSRRKQHAKECMLVADLQERTAQLPEMGGNHLNACATSHRYKHAIAERQAAR